MLHVAHYFVLICCTSTSKQFKPATQKLDSHKPEGLQTSRVAGIFQHTPVEPECGLFMADVQRRWPSGQTDSGRRYREQGVRVE